MILYEKYPIPIGGPTLSQIKLFGNNHARPRYLERSAGEPRFAADIDGDEEYARSPLKPLTIILAVLAILEALYFVAIYSNIPFIAR